MTFEDAEKVVEPRLEVRQHAGIGRGVNAQ